MLPYTLISPSAAFSAAFRDVGMGWAVYFVAIGALMGIVTGARVCEFPVSGSMTEIDVYKNKYFSPKGKEPARIICVIVFMVISSSLMESL